MNTFCRATISCLITLFVFSCSTFLSAQEINVDSLKGVVSSKISLEEKEEALWKLMEEISWTEAAYSETLGDSLMRLAKVQSDSSSIMEILRYKGMTQRAVGNYVNSLQTYQRVYDFHKRQRDTINMAIAASQIGIINLFSGNMSKAQVYLLEAHAFYQAKGTSVQLANSNNALASFYLDNELPEKAFERYNMALEAYEKAEDINGMANVNANLGLAYIDAQDYEKAEFHLRQQGKLDSILDTPYGLGFHFDFMGYLYSEQGDLEKAYKNFKIALGIREGLHSHYNIDESRTSVAGVLQKMGRHKEAISEAKQLFDNVELQRSLTHQQSGHRLLAEAYESVGEYALALKHHRDFKMISDSIYNRDKLEEITENDARFNRVEQESKIALLNSENQSNSALLDQKNRTIAIGGASLVLITLLSFFLYRLLSKVSNQKEMLSNALKDKDLLIKEIHHRVKNNLQLVSSLLSLQSKSIDDPTVSDAIAEGKARVRSMALIHQDLYQRDNLTGVNVNSYLDDLCNELFASYKVDNEHVKLNLDIIDITLDVDTVIPMGLIINELITNSLKYAFPNNRKGNLSISLQQIKDELHLSVSDDGVGYSASENTSKKSFGSTLIRALSKQLDGTLKIDHEKGTKVSMVFKKFVIS